MRLKKIKDYYSEKIKLYGPTSKGVDWNTIESQYLRFNRLTTILSRTDKSTILDYGCGYGALLDYLINEYPSDAFTYSGYDISSEMIKEAKKKFPSNAKKFKNTFDIKNRFDYVFASGIFNVKLDAENKDWEKYVLSEIEILFNASKKGISFNLLTSYSDIEFRSDKLYYADPSFYFNWCMKNLSKNVKLDHHYPLYEFTISIIK